MFATKNVAQSINHKIELKQNEFKWHPNKILVFERFLSKIRDVEKIASYIQFDNTIVLLLYLL